MMIIFRIKFPSVLVPVFVNLSSTQQQTIFVEFRCKNIFLRIAQETVQINIYNIPLGDRG